MDKARIRVLHWPPVVIDPAAVGSSPGARTRRHSLSPRPSARRPPRRSDTDAGSCPTTAANAGPVGLLVAADCGHCLWECRGDTEDHVGKPNALDHCRDVLRYAWMVVIG